MTPGREIIEQELEWKKTLTPEARNVLRAFEDARRLAPGFLLSCGVLPELSEAVTERLHHIVHALAGHRFERNKQVSALKSAIRKTAGHDGKAFDRVETPATAVAASETTAAYLFGLAVGLSIGAFPDRVRV